MDPLARGLGAPVRQTLVIARELEQNASVRSRMSAALRILDRMEAADYIPERFADAILYGCAQQGISIALQGRSGYCKRLDAGRYAGPYPFARRGEAHREAARLSGRILAQAHEV